MKTLGLLILAVVFAQPALADKDFKGWKWGVGFVQQPAYKSGFQIELGSPAINKAETVITSVILTAGTQSTELEKIRGENYRILPFRLMFEFRNLVYKDLASSYFRVGAGYIKMPGQIDNDGKMWTLPVQFGVDIIAAESDFAMNSFFAQFGQDIFFSSDETQLSRNYNGMYFILGLRTAF